MEFWTKKAPESQTYCSYYLKDKELMESLGVYNNNHIDEEICCADFSLLIDDLGDYESFMKENKIKSIPELRSMFKQLLADREELKKLKSSLHLPCKPGDKVWVKQVFDGKAFVKPSIIAELRITDRVIIAELSNSSSYIAFDYFGNIKEMFPDEIYFDLESALNKKEN